MQPLSFACDAVENLTGARCLDGAFGCGNDFVRAALKETATDGALLTGSKGSGSLMTKATRRRIFARSPGVTPIPRIGSTLIPRAHKEQQKAPP